MLLDPILHLPQAALMAAIAALLAAISIMVGGILVLLQKRIEMKDSLKEKGERMEGLEMGIFVFIFVCVCTNVCVCTYVYVYLYIYIYIYQFSEMASVRPDC
jgi:hypothetical protein